MALKALPRSAVFVKEQLICFPCQANSFISCLSQKHKTTVCTEGLQGLT